MTTAIFTNIDQYANVHEAFRLDNLNTMAAANGIQIFCNVLPSMNDTEFVDYSNVTYCFSNTNRAEQWAEFYLTHKPTKVVNYIDYLTPWHYTQDYEFEKIWFVRSLYAEVLEKNTHEVKNEKWLDREQVGIVEADKVICTSPTSQAAIKKHYNIDAELVLEYVDPTKFLQMDVPTSFSKTAHFTGRFDSQKRFDLISEQTDWTIVGIGDKVLGDTTNANITTHGIMPFETYKDYIKDSVFGLFPAVWESNGYGVQECLAMGKIPIIHTGSGGHERLCNETNSISIDWSLDNWSEIAESSYNASMHEAARDSLTVSMYETSRDKFLNAIL